MLGRMILRPDRPAAAHRHKKTMSQAPVPPVPATAAEAIERALAVDGHVFVEAADMRRLLEAAGPLSDWAAFTASWDDMPVDTFMADGGRYRRRRYAVFAADAEGLHRQPHQPHYQGLEYNRLNGGVARWFEPVPDAIAQGTSLQAVLRCCHALFGTLAPQARRWHIELHQFRIEAIPGESGKPTPEGKHRDGVDYVLVLLVRRINIASGTTTIHSPDDRDLGSFTLTHPFDATLIDDHRVFHGVTPVQPIDPAQPAYRDVLVVTFRALAD